jgi:hypothetical protein
MNKTILKEAALRYANHIRKQHGLPPVAEMQKGRPKKAGCCPLARTIGLPGIYVTSQGVSSAREYTVLAWHPYLVKHFIAAVDSGAYPELVEQP